MHEAETRGATCPIRALARISFRFSRDGPEPRFYSITTYTLGIRVDADDSRVHKSARKLRREKWIAFGTAADQTSEWWWHCIDPEGLLHDILDCAIV